MSWGPEWGAPDRFILLVAAPVAALLAAWIWKRRERDLAAWAWQGLWNRLGVRWSRRRVALTVAALTATVVTLVLALARPRWGEVEERTRREGVDVVVVLDSSLSMAARDILPSRLDVARELTRRLASELPGHRLALVQAEGAGTVLAPLTTDTAVIDLLLDTVEPASLPTPGTDLRAAISAAIRLFPEQDRKHRAMILISDGEDHGDESELIAQLERAGIRVHTLGVGTLEGAPIPLGIDDGYKEDDAGRIVVTRLGEPLLESLALETGGTYVRVDTIAVDLSALLDSIDGMEKRSVDGTPVTVLAERFQWPLAVAALCCIVLVLSRPMRSARPVGDRS